MSDQINIVWLELITNILQNGQDVSPRGKLTRELAQHTIQVDMRYPVLTIKERKLGYQFMAAEAYWILGGDNKVATIAPYNPNIAQFSDDGITFFGAYGPKILDQIDYVIEKLLLDKDSRQAGMTIWRENPPETKDVPCTVAIFFSIRNDYELNCHVFMRSSDAWLGIPYDVFNFSILAHTVCSELYRRGLEVTPGTLYLTAASSHLYSTHFEAANSIALCSFVPPQKPTPTAFYRDTAVLASVLDAIRVSKPGDEVRWWER